MSGAEDDVTIDPIARVRAQQRRERQRVLDTIARDRLDKAKEDTRKLAELEVGSGVFVNLADTVIEPTPEWLEKGDVRSFVPKQPDGTVRTIATVRRVLTPIIVRMHGAGKITDDHAAACLWFRARFDEAGLEGRFKTSHISLTGNTGGGGGGMAQAPMARHEAEVEARRDYRAARLALPAHLVRFFEAIVLNDLPLRRASRFARCRNDQAFNLFRTCAEKLVEHCASADVDLAPDADGRDD